MDFRAFTDAEGGLAATSLLLAKPAGVVLDDLMVAFLSGHILAPAWVAPAGWVAVGTEQAYGGAVASAVRMFRKVAGSGEPADYTFTCAANDKPLGIIVAYRNVYTVTPIGDVKQLAPAGVTNTAHGIPQCNERKYAPYLIAGMAFDAITGTSTLPSQWTLRRERIGAGTPNRRILVCDRAWLSSDQHPAHNIVTTTPSASASIACAVQRVPEAFYSAGRPVPVGAGPVRAGGPVAV